MTGMHKYPNDKQELLNLRNHGYHCYRSILEAHGANMVPRASKPGHGVL